MIFDILFLPIVFFIGLITSYEDIKYGKVRNKWILLGLIWGLVVIFSFFVWYFIASPISLFYYFDVLNSPDNSPAPVFTVSLVYLEKIIINALIALAISFLMWRSNAWAAGDAKLFFVYSLLIPLKYYWKSYLPYFPSFVLLINIFIPILLYLLVRASFHYFKSVYFWLIYRFKIDSSKTEKYLKIKVQKKEKKESNRGKRIWETVKNMMIMLVFFIGIFLFFGLFQQPIKEYTSIDISSWQMFIFAGLIIFRGSLSKFFNYPLVVKTIIIILIFIFGYGFIFSPQSAWQIFYQSIKIMIVFMIAFILFRKLIDFYILKTSIEKIKIDEIKPRISLTEETLNILKEDKEYYDKYIDPIYPDGLTVKQAEAVKKWFEKNKEQKMETVSIYKPFPFVLWMFLGVVITLILKSSLLHLFIDLG